MKMKLDAQSPVTRPNLRRLVDSLYQAFRRSNDAVFYTDPSGVILDINEAFTRVYGYTPEEAIGKTAKILQSNHSTREMYERMWNSILDPKIGFWRGEIINRSKDGRDVPVLLTITSVRDQDGEIVGYVSNGLDVSEQVHLQARVAHSEALAHLGEMAAIMAHEIRNPLGSIVMASKQLSAGDLSPEDKETVLQVLKGESKRLNEVLTNFLAYARPRELKLGPCDFNELVREVCAMVKSSPDAAVGVDLHMELSGEIDPFPMDADQIRQVIWNIVINAIQAMDGRGKLSLTTSRSKDMVYAHIRDDGPGMSESAMNEIFKPFHTTKSQGTGLGLAIAERIVAAHGGNIQVESRLGEGSVFKIALPVVHG